MILTHLILFKFWSGASLGTGGGGGGGGLIRDRIIKLRRQRAFRIH